MYQFETREDGLLVTHDNGRAVAHVTTAEVKLHSHVDGDPKKPKLAEEQRTVVGLPRDKHRIHFTAYRFSLDDLAAFMTELGAALKQ